MAKEKDAALEAFPGSENRKTREAYRALLEKRKGATEMGGILMPRSRAHRNKKAYNRRTWRRQTAD